MVQKIHQGKEGEMSNLSNQLRSYEWKDLTFRFTMCFTCFFSGSLYIFLCLCLFFFSLSLIRSLFIFTFLLKSNNCLLGKMSSTKHNTKWILLIFMKKNWMLYAYAIQNKVRIVWHECVRTWEIAMSQKRNDDLKPEQSSIFSC